MLIFLPGFALSVLAAVFCHRLPSKKQKILLNILAVLLPLSELWKQLLLTHAHKGTYQIWYFPFQLCSTSLYLLPLRQLLLARPNPRTCDFAIRTITDFLSDFGLLAGIFAFADQTGMHYAIPVLTWHSYLWHFIMIFLGLFLILSRRSGIYSRSCRTVKKFSYLRSFLPAAALFLLLAGIAEIINFLFHTRGAIDMFYISPWEPSTQVILRDIADQFGRNTEILLYLCMILVSAGLIHWLTLKINSNNLNV